AVSAATPRDLLRAIEAITDGGQADTRSPSAADPATNDPGDLLMGSFGTPGSDGTAPGPPGHTAAEWLYAVYAWPVFIVIGVLSWLLVVLAPFSSWRRKLAHYGARSLFACTFTPLTVSGHEHADPDKPHIIVANHASYLDGLILTAALDLPIHFIVKGELARNAPIRLLLHRFGVEFVDRFNATRGASDVNRIVKKSKGGQTIVFFPEGTFINFPGLQPFRMGAFVTAARSHVPVTPVAIKGARAMVRGDDWFPRRGHIEVTVCPPIMPSGEGWQMALNLRDAARHEIARYCGEPDLVEAETKGLLQT
ncbi:MAG: lysophospholipid acyltransferase family protein, partial [Gammaproteobacteria bacterium]